MTSNKFIAITQRNIDCDNNEERDSLDKRWCDFLLQCELIPLLIPNNIDLAKEILSRVNLDGILLTGGGDIATLGGKDKDREAVEEYLIKISLVNNIPLIGVCRGMQKIQDYFGIKLQKINNHINPKQKISINNQDEFVNSYHNFGTTENNDDEFIIWAKAEDGVVKAIKHKKQNVSGIMWHPERINPFRKQDIEYFNNFYR